MENVGAGQPRDHGVGGVVGCSGQGMALGESLKAQRHGQPDAESVHGQFNRVQVPLSEKPRAVAAHLDAARDTPARSAPWLSLVGVPRS